jgi:hypothetical protein
MGMTVLHAACYLLCVPLKDPKDVKKLAREIERCARHLSRFAELRARGPIQPRTHPEVTQATGRFERINQTLKDALKAGYLSAAQEKSIANNFAGIAAALEKGAGSKR